MTFDEQYSEDQEGLVIEFEGDEYIKDASSGLCWNCGRATNYVSVSFMTYICSERCSREKWNEYLEAATGSKKETDADRIRKELGYD